MKSHLDVLISFERSVHSCLSLGKENIALENSCIKIKNSLQYILKFVHDSPELLPIACRDLSYSLARTYIGKFHVFYAHMLFI